MRTLTVSRSPDFAHSSSCTSMSLLASGISSVTVIATEPTYQEHNNRISFIR